MPSFQASTTAGTAPRIDPAMYDAVLVRVEEKRLKTGQFVKDTVNGDLKLEWYFIPLDENDEPMYDGGEVIEVNKLTGTGFNILSKTVPQEVRVLKALLTASEFKAFEAGEGTPDSDLQAPAGLLGRKAQIEVFVKENGWPGIGNVVAPRGGQKGTPALKDTSADELFRS